MGGRSLVSLFAFVALAASAHAATDVPAQLALYDGQTLASVAYDPDGGAPIRKAAELLSHDLQQISDRKPDIEAGVAAGHGTGVIVGLASSPRIAELLRKNGLSSSAIDGKWESYGRAVIPAPWDPKARALLIFGSDTRGAVWGVVDLTREMGVSAWEWWADVKTRTRDRINVSAASSFSRPPSVKYRGFFINASFLREWAGKTFDQEAHGIGPRTYERVFELMWRLKANLIWPAMNSTDPAFNLKPENYDTAADYAVIRGSSHVEMLLRNNGVEWDEKTMGPYNWTTNKQRLIEYWRGAVDKWGKYDNLYTVGMRGVDDFPMEGADSAAKMGDILRDVIQAQRKILSTSLGKPAAQIPQAFTPYKEVTAAYNTGRIQVPDDVTIIWPDDNYGYLLRLNDARERKRSGGSGIYYHATFWGAPGNYLLLPSTDPNLMWEEMTRAYHGNARSVWMLNVGNIKPVEYLLDFYLAMAFDMESFAKPGSAHAYMDNWAVRNFGAEQGARVADVMWRYYKLAFGRNPEFMAFNTTFPMTSVQQSRFSITDFGDENARRADAYKTIMDASKDLEAALPADRKSAFYELVGYPVAVGGNMNLQQLAMDKSIAYGLQRRASANAYAQEAQRAHDAILANVRRYGEDIEGGKWRYISNSYPQSLTNYLPPAIPAWSIPTDAKRCPVQVEGGGFFDDKDWFFPTLPTFSPELGDRSYYLDVFTSQPLDATWSATPSVPWIRVDKTAGRFSQADGYEQRLEVSIDWAKAPKQAKDGLVHISCSVGQQPIDVHVRVAPPITDRTASFIDSQGVVSMYAAHADRITGAWQILDGVGHTGADVQAALDLQPIDPANPAALAKAPRMLYRFHTLKPERDYSFPNYVFDEIVSLRAVALPLFPATIDGKMRIAVSIDGAPPHVLDFGREYYAATWRQNVLDNEVAAEIPNLPIKPGNHTLEVYALDPAVTLDRFEVRFVGASKGYGPVPETRIAQ
ncbi:glycosyl hydrolase 115 family protein [Pseudoduganella sp. RAF53_2]|uniref:glycosyl hydrolase 115 family protein n=1 Tax=unclassified Pseudoduganella TaxID=2637179 RepID=UPI003F95DE6A